MSVERHLLTAATGHLHPFRALDLTASDIGAAAGISPYKSALRLYAEKTGMVGGPTETPLMRRGRWFEQAAAAALHEKHPTWEIKPAGLYLRDPELRLGATPDYVAQTDKPGLTNIQIKTIAAPEFAKSWRDGAPIHYQLQALTEAMLLDAARSLVVALVVDTYSAEIHEFEVPRHEIAEARIRAIATRFWALVAAGTPPAVTPTLDAETLDEMHPESAPEPVLDLTGDNHLPAVLAEREELKDRIKVAEGRIGEIDVIIKDKLGGHEKALLPGWKLSWKSQHRDEYTVPAKDFRVLRVTKQKEIMGA